MTNLLICKIKEENAGNAARRKLKLTNNQSLFLLNLIKSMSMPSDTRTLRTCSKSSMKHRLY